MRASLAVLAAVAALLAVAFLVTSSARRSREAVARELARGDEARRSAQLEDALRRRDAEIARLEARAAELERALAERSAPVAETAADAAPALPPGAELVSPAPTPRRVVARSSEGLLARLRALDPERFAQLLPVDLAVLEELDLHGQALTDEDLAELATLPSLKSLGLRGTPISDPQLAHLSGLALESLDLRGTQVSGQGMHHLPAWSLEALHLTDTRVEGDHLFGLPAMPRLKTLKLNRLGVGDGHVEALSAYPGLEHVELDGTAVTAAGVHRLLELLPSLRRLEIRRAGIDRAEANALRAAYPDCQIVVHDW